MTPLAFTPGLSLPLSRPRAIPLRRSHLSPRQIRASADESARQAAHKVLSETPSRPDTVFGGLPPALRSLAGIAIVAGTSTAAYFATPPRGYVRPGAAVVGGSVAVAGVLSMQGGTRKAAKRKLARLIQELGTDGELATAVEKMKGMIGEDDFSEVKREMYEMYLSATVENGNVSFGEISKLVRLKAALALDGAAIGDAHYEACRAFYRANVVFLGDDDDERANKMAQKRLDKLVFLSDRMFTDKETEEGYRYERSRLYKFFRIDEQDYEDRVARVALPFYRQVVERACVDATVTKEDLQAVQDTLGVKQIAVERIHADAYADLAERLVSQKGRLEENDNAVLGRLRLLLEIEDDRASSALKTLAEPIFRVDVGAALDAIKKGEESLASIYGRLALRQSELSFPADAAKVAMAKEITERVSEMIKKTSKYLRVQNINGCIGQVRELLSFVDGVIGLIKVPNDDYEDDAEIVEVFIPNAATALSRMEPRQIYRIFLSKCLEDRKISKEEETQLIRLRAILSLSERDALEAFKAAAGPVYMKVVTDAVMGAKFDDETKSNIVKIKNDLSLPLGTSRGIDVELYRQKLMKMVEGNRILQEHEAQELFVARQFLDLTPDDTDPVHKSLVGPVYEQSVTEAMGPTGIMLEEYKSGLERLRARLGLSEKDADESFKKVIKQRMLMYVNRAMSQLEKRQLFRGQNEERDVGDDPNIKRAGAVLGIEAGGLPIELSNLVDFYVRNGLVKEEEIEHDGEKRNITRYPITLRGELQPKVYTELYKQYVIQCFSAQTRGEKQRLFGVLDQLGSILGLQGEEVENIHSQIGTVIYKNYVNQALLKGPVEEKDTEFLKNIQQMLSMKEEHCANLLRDAKESRVSTLLEQIASQPKVLPETVKRMRTTASALSVDLVKDLSVSIEQRKKLFGIEIDAGIDSGALSPNNQSLVQEVKQSLQLDDNSAREVLLACIQRRTLSHLVQAAASLRQDRTEAAVAELKTMLRYGKLLPAKVNAPAVSISEKRELYLLFQADVITDDVVGKQAREEINLLKTMFGFADADLELVS